MWVTLSDQLLPQLEFCIMTYVTKCLIVKTCAGFGEQDQDLHGFRICNGWRVV